MSIEQKLRVIESVAVPKENPKVEVLGTSIKTTFTCGCVLVEHFATSTRINRAFSLRERYFVELCKDHKYLDDQS